MKRVSRKSASSLAIVEKAFRGALEEQYGNIVWLSECMRAMKARHNLLLCGSAVATCFVQQQQQSLVIGDLHIKTLSHFGKSVSDLISQGGRVWVLASDLDRFSSQYQLIQGVEKAASMARLCLEHDKVWFW